MARTVIIPSTEVTEDIQSIFETPGQRISCTVGKMELINGQFEFKVPQQFETFDLTGDLYKEFIAKYTTAYSKDDLWEFVDRLRLGAKDPRPSKNYEWDNVTKAWVPNLAKAIEAKKLEVEELRTAKDIEPIPYAGSLYDANALAKENVQGKITDINAAEALGNGLSPLIWWDVNNVVTVFETIQDYKLWVQGLWAAIAKRRTNLMIAAKQIKAAIPTDDITAIETFDITIGWD